MGGWNYFEDTPSPRAHWNYGPGDFDDLDRPSLSDLADEDYEDDDEDRYISDPGFPEDRVGAIQTQAQQFPHRI